MFSKSEHIYLRALEPTDLELLYVSENNQNVWAVSNTLAPFSKDVLEQYLQTAHQDIYTNKQLRLMICANDTNDCIGTIDLFDFEPTHGRVGIGILIFEPFRKNGFAAQAIELVKDYTYRILFMNQLYCNISSLNTESMRLFERCGFQKIAVKKKWNRIAANEFEDEYMYQLIF